MKQPPRSPVASAQPSVSSSASPSASSGLPTARELAARILLRVERDGAFAAAALDAEIERYPQLDPRDRGLLTEIVYGALRTRPWLEKQLAQLAPRGIPDLEVRVHLLVAAYQLVFLDRVPAFAAVNSAVTAVSRLRGPKVSGFVNAVLRRFSAGGKRFDTATAVIESTPAWLWERLVAAVGEEEARGLLVAPHPQSLRLVAGRPVPEWLSTAPQGRLSPRSRVVRESGDPRRMPGYDAGAFVMQEEGAQAVALALGVRPGERVLDVCAGRGHKSSLLREQAGPNAELWATDLYPEKLAILEREHQRLGLIPPRTAAVDFTVGVGPLPRDFDRVLVDAPCSGVGTLRRRPEIAFRLGPEDPARIAQVTAPILRNAALCLRPQGRLVFAVCSVFQEEAEAVVAQVTDLLAPAPFDAPELAKFLPSDATQIRFLPIRHGTDGYFVASFVRRG